MSTAPRASCRPFSAAEIPLLFVLPSPQARLKYLISEWGMDKFRSVVEQYLGKQLEVSACAVSAHLRWDWKQLWWSR